MGFEVFGVFAGITTLVKLGFIVQKKTNLFTSASKKRHKRINKMRDEFLGI